MENEMVTMKLSNKTYAELMRLKNLISMRTKGITNPKVLEKLDVKNGVCGIDSNSELFGKLMREMDFAPEFTMEKYLNKIVDMIWHEQETGKVDFIT